MVVPGEGLFRMSEVPLYLARLSRLSLPGVPVSAFQLYHTAARHHVPKRSHLRTASLENPALYKKKCYASRGGGARGAIDGGRDAEPGRLVLGAPLSAFRLDHTAVVSISALLHSRTPSRPKKEPSTHRTS
jgi:hypothetical protein